MLTVSCIASKSHYLTHVLLQYVSHHLDTTTITSQLLMQKGHKSVLRVDSQLTKSSSNLGSTGRDVYIDNTAV